MPKLPVFKGKELIKLLEYLGFQVTRTKGSHSRLISEDGRATSVLVHGKKDIPKGLLRKIIEGNSAPVSRRHPSRVMLGRGQALLRVLG